MISLNMDEYEYNLESTIVNEEVAVRYIELIFAENGSGIDEFFKMIQWMSENPIPEKTAPLYRMMMKNSIGYICNMLPSRGALYMRIIVEWLNPCESENDSMCVFVPSPETFLKLKSHFGGDEKLQKQFECIRIHCKY
jgi:hypothetical protein